MRKAQATIEYLLIVAVVLIIVALTSFFIFDIFGAQSEEATFKACMNAASSCNKNKVFYGDSYDCFKVCYDGCLTTEGVDVLTQKETECFNAYHEKFDGSACGYCNAGLMHEIRPPG
jgi:hypothetical protein